MFSACDSNICSSVETESIPAGNDGGGPTVVYSLLLKPPRLEPREGDAPSGFWTSQLSLMGFPGSFWVLKFSTASTWLEIVLIIVHSQNGTSKLCFSLFTCIYYFYYDKIIFAYFRSKVTKITVMCICYIYSIVSQSEYKLLNLWLTNKQRNHNMRAFAWLADCWRSLELLFPSSSHLFSYATRLATNKNAK